MKKVALLLTAIMVLSVAAAYAADSKCGVAEDTKSLSSNPIGDTIDQTASIKEMQSKPHKFRGFARDILGNKVSTETDNSGKNYLGR